MHDKKKDRQMEIFTDEHDDLKKEPELEQTNKRPNRQTKVRTKCKENITMTETDKQMDGK